MANPILVMIIVVAAASLLAAATAVMALVAGTALLTEAARAGKARRPLTLDERLEAEYRAARRAMNDASGQSWRNIVD